MQNKKIPMRMCVGCHEMKSKKELVRIVRSKEEKIFIDLTGKQSGRGAYICKSANCLKKARKAKSLERAFAVAVPDEVYEQMEKELSIEQND